MTKTKKFRQLLIGRKPTVIVAAHNALSARLVEEAGFDGVWASSFEISASYAMPDANILTMFENLNVTKSMNDGIGIPVIADCDNGYGNAINVMRTVEEYEKAGIAGISIEDNIFPKRCSFYTGVKRELETIEEFAGKVRAAKEAQKSKDFVVIARTEALIAGYGQEEALRRADAYARAGADMIMPHSKAETPKQVLDFAKEWYKDHDTPLVSVPTIYKDTSVDELHKAGFKLIIFANHGIRASIKAMRQVFRALKEGQKAAAADKYVVPLTDVYGLIGVQKMRDGESRYLPKGKEVPKAIILSAGKPPEKIRIVTGDVPVPMLDVRGKSLLERQIETFRDYNIQDISVVRGFMGKKINLPDINYYDNPDFEKKGILHSLFTAKEKLSGSVIVSLGDMLFDEEILGKLLSSKKDMTVVVDRSWIDSPTLEHRPDLVRTRGRFVNGKRFYSLEKQRQVLEVGVGIDPRKANGEFIGLMLLSDKGAKIFKRVYQDCLKKYKGKKFHGAESIGTADLTDMLQEIIGRGHKVYSLDIYKGWMDIDSFEDFRRAWAQKG